MKKQIKDSLMPFLTSEEIQILIQKLSQQIEYDYRGKELVLICPLRGSIHFAADLMRAIDLPQVIDFVYVRATEKGGPISIIKDISTDLRGKDVLIVEEIIDTARTLQFLKQRIQSAGPESLRIVTLLDKPARRELPIRADYIGKTIDDRYVVGYGMDLDEIGRNYRDIYHLKN